MNMKILIADSLGIVRQGLRVLLEKQDDMEVIGEAQDGRATVRLAKELLPDVIITDIKMPDLDGIRATQLIRRHIPDARIIALSRYHSNYLVIEMLRAGALGYVLKSCLFDELIMAIRTVMKNQRYLSPQVADVLVENYIKHPTTMQDNPLHTLTDRERQIVHLLAEGRSTKQVGSHLGISPKTADANRRHIMKKLRICSLAELTKYAIREGLTSVEV